MRCTRAPRSPTFDLPGSRAERDLLVAVLWKHWAPSNLAA
jgi:hypothetical protein